jgi:hypothetical protein
MEAMTLEREWLASYLDDGGWHDEAANVRNGIDLESYETDLRLIDWLRRHTHLSQPAQAVDVDTAMESWHSVHCDISDIERNSLDERFSRRAQNVRQWIERNRPDRALSVQKAGPVARVRHFDYRGIARNGFSQEAVMLDGAPVLPDGTPLYALPASPTPGKEAPERCESGSSACGPVEHHDSEGVPLCAKCWQALAEDSAACPEPDEEG